MTTPPDQPTRDAIAAAFELAAADFDQRAVNSSPSPSVAQRSTRPGICADRWRAAADVLRTHAHAYRSGIDIEWALTIGTQR